MKQKNNPLVNIENLKIYFGSSENPVRAVDDVSVSITPGDFVAFAGESGCGKSMTAYALTRLLPRAARWEAGQIYIKGRDVSQMNHRALHALRGGTVAYIFQEPGSSLNPVMRVGHQIAEAVKRHQPATDNETEVLRLMQRVGLPEPKQKRKAFPHELSGGMQQRIMIAMALACRPDLLVADEPTTALDVTIQAQIIDLLCELNRELGMAVWLITHNLGLVHETAKRLYIMYAGKIVEEGLTADVLKHPAHPYTQKLVKAIPQLDKTSKRLQGIPGQLPVPDDWPTGCRFHPRCERADERCRQTEPSINSVGEQHHVACHFPSVCD